MLKTIFKNLLLRVETLINYQNDSEKTLTEELENLKKQKEISQQLAIYFAACLKSNADSTKKSELLVESTNKEQNIMAITKRKDGRYVKTITIDNNRIWVYGKTKEECKINYAKTKKTLTKNSIQNKKKRIKVIDWLNEWQETYKKNFVSEKTNQELKNIINTKLKTFHNIYLDKIDTTMLQKYFNQIPKSRIKEKTILYFNASMQKAVDIKLLNYNPFNAFIKDKKIKVIKPPFTFEEQEKILSRLEKETIKPIILIYLLTGLRKNELNTKTIENDIDYVNKTLKAVNLKQREDEPTYKIIDLTQGTIDLILKNKDVIHSLSTDMVYDKFKQILKELNINGTLHTLRHTFATNCMYLGIPTKIYSKWLGHSTTQITDDIYTGIDKNITKEKINKLYNNLYVNF